MNGKPITPEIKERIISYRNRNKLSQRGIAKILGISQRSVTLVLNAKKKEAQQYFDVNEYYRRNATI